jgi:multiple sugar transport system permease protein
MRLPYRLWLLMIAGGVTAVFFLFPYAVMLLTALKPDHELITVPPKLFPQHWEFKNFVDVWKAAPIGRNLVVTLIVAGASTVIAVAAALPAAYYTARRRFRGRQAYLYLVLITQMFSPIALLVGLYREFLRVGLVDSIWSLVITNAAFNLAFTVWLLNAYFESIPVELEEAAWVDGASRRRTLVQVVLPLALPGVVTSVIFSFISAWNEYVIALTLINSAHNQPLTVGVTAFMGLNHTQWQYLFATSLLAIVPVVILFGLIERYLVSGLTAGAVK